eukprot:511263-Pleurochrysis_carterae.AAC.3
MLMCAERGVWAGKQRSGTRKEMRHAVQYVAVNYNGQHEPGIAREGLPGRCQSIRAFESILS